MDTKRNQKFKYHILAHIDFHFLKLELNTNQSINDCHFSFVTLYQNYRRYPTLITLQHSPLITFGTFEIIFVVPMTNSSWIWLTPFGGRDFFALIFMTYHRVCNESNMTGATSRAGTALPFRSTWVHSWFLVVFVFLDL